MPLDLAIINADIHGHAAPVNAVGIMDGHIVAIGPSSDIMAQCDPGTVIRDLGGMFLMPGFIDVHMHIAMAADYLSAIGLRDVRSMKALLERIAEWAAAHPDTPWIRGLEWSYGYPDLPDGEFDARMIDSILPDRPVILTSGMAHAAWANSRAMEIAGITRDTPDPENGEIVRRADGTPSGWLKEDAVHLVTSHIPPMTGPEMDHALGLVLDTASRLGITRMQSAAYDEAYLPLLSARDAAGTLPVRIGMMTEIEPDPGLTPQRLREALELRARYDNAMVRLDGIKFFLDGVLESHTGYMPEGYADQPDARGTLLWDRTAYIDAVRTGVAHGLDIWTHAIGPGAVHLALDAAENAGNSPGRARIRVEHAELPYPDDIARFASTATIASMQPVMIAPADEWMGMEGVWKKRVGDNRAQLAFPMRALLDAGSMLAFGTDWPIVSLDPLRGLRKAVLRRPIGAPSSEAWIPTQAISFPEAFDSYTAKAAVAAGRERHEGRIALGYRADIAVLSGNPFMVDPDSLPDLKCMLTVTAGRIVHDLT